MLEVYLATRWEDRHEFNVIHRGAVLDGENGRNGALGFLGVPMGRFSEQRTFLQNSDFSPISASRRLYATTIGVGTKFATFFYIFLQ